jgi:chaperonin GroES
MADLKLRPLADRVVIEPLDQEERTASGLYIPETAKEKPQQGVVVAVGPGARKDDSGERHPLDVQVGDRVLFARYAGTDFKVHGKELKILKESDLLAVIVESLEAVPA